MHLCLVKQRVLFLFNRWRLVWRWWRSTALNFYPCDAMRKRGLCCRRVCVSVCLSVSLSHADIASKQLKRVLKLFWPAGSPIILVFWPLVLVPNLEGNPFSGALNTREVGKIGNFRLKSPFILETVPDGCYVTLIGSHKWRIDMWRFRWPWMTFDPDFKVTTFFEV